jgi:hypothetical protein
VLSLDDAADGLHRDDQVGNLIVPQVAQPGHDPLRDDEDVAFYNGFEVDDAEREPDARAQLGSSVT